MTLSIAAREHRTKQAREYYILNKQRIAARQREWYLRNREKRRTQTATWQRDNRKKINAHRLAHPEIYLASARRWRAAHKSKNAEVQRAADLKKKYAKYGITADRYDALVRTQHGRCAICGEVPNGKKARGRLHVDHCHARDRFRALICGNCNTALGMVGDSIERLEKLIAYLKHFDR